MTDKIREAFEKFHAEHLRKMGMDEHDIATERDRLENGDYQWSMAAEAWPYWEAAAALAQQPAPASVLDERHPVGGLDHGWKGEYNRGWNDCRAAMLAAQKGQSHE